MYEIIRRIRPLETPQHGTQFPSLGPSLPEHFSYRNAPRAHSALFPRRPTVHTSSPSFSERLERIGFPATEIPIALICPIFYQIMNRPVIDQYGHIYDEDFILAWFKRSTTSPLNRQPLKPSDLKLANLLEYDIEEFVEKEEHKAQEERCTPPLPPIRLALGFSTLFQRLNTGEEDCRREHDDVEITLYP